MSRKSRPPVLVRKMHATAGNRTPTGTHTYCIWYLDWYRFLLFHARTGTYLVRYRLSPDSRVSAGRAAPATS
eukprot:scaffold207291_cov22-Prasinocladus_malaysianus.AAC.1